MKIEAVRKHAMALEAVTEEPHHESSSFRVCGRIFATVPPVGGFIHVFCTEEDRERALALYPGFVEKLHWGGKVVGVRVALASANATAVKSLISGAHSYRARGKAKPKAPGARARSAKR